MAALKVPLILEVRCSLSHKPEVSQQPPLPPDSLSSLTQFGSDTESIGGQQLADSAQPSQYGNPMEAHHGSIPLMISYSPGFQTSHNVMRGTHFTS